MVQWHTMGTLSPCPTFHHLHTFACYLSLLRPPSCKREANDYSLRSRSAHWTGGSGFLWNHLGSLADHREACSGALRKAAKLQSCKEAHCSGPALCKASCGSTLQCKQGRPSHRHRLHPFLPSRLTPSCQLPHSPSWPAATFSLPCRLQPNGPPTKWPISALFAPNMANIKPKSAPPLALAGLSLCMGRQLAP